MAPPVTPTTPTKRRAVGSSGNLNDLNQIFLSISEQYSLGLSLPDTIRSPAKSRELGDPAELIYNRLRFHCHKNNIHVMLERFRESVIAESKKWVEKPNAEWHVTPSVSGLPKASNHQQRQDLKRLLLKVLDECRPKVEQPNRRPFVRSQSNPLYQLPGTPGKQEPQQPSSDPSQIPSQSKRLSDERHGSTPPKRTKSAVSENSSRSISDIGGEVTSPGKAISPLYFSKPQNRSMYGLSTNSSEETVSSSHKSAVFSFAHKSPGSQETQTTVEASTQEKKRFPPEVSCIYEASEYSMNASSVQASHESFKKLESKAGVQNVNDDGNSVARTNYSYSESSMPLDHDAKLASLDSPVPTASPSKPGAAKKSVEERLEDVWPQIPSCLDDAPMAVIWEIVRVFLHCGVSMSAFNFKYNASWMNQDILWQTFKKHPQLQEKPLPERCQPDAWAAATMKNFQSHGEVVVLSALIDFSSLSTGPLLRVALQPLRLDLSHRLSRRFGSDRFFEILVPSLESNNSISAIRNIGKQGVECVTQWLLNASHCFLGRIWRPFFVRFIRDSASRKPTRNESFGPDPKPIMRDRVYLFAETGNNFRFTTTPTLPPKDEDMNKHTNMDRRGLLDWHLQTANNEKQPYLKLFSRIALGLSRTRPTVILQPDQIRHKEHDLLSPSGKVMNDGIGRLSASLARKIRDILGLIDIPAGFQGRIGSAKGFWIRDVTDDSGEDWIETYPSQRKWHCSFMDEDHRTFEVRSESRELMPASLNTQFLPIIEEQTLDRQAMKSYIGTVLSQTLTGAIEEQRMALEDPVQFRLWAHNNGSQRAERLRDGEVSFVGGLPRSKNDQMAFLVDGGFHPKKQKFLWELGWELRKEKCEELKDRLNIKIGRSAYAYMVIDFQGVLKEDEIHLGFSSKFKGNDFSETFLHGMDVLVARSPAHFVSDIQKVKAVFKPELGSLKDVVIFPSTGNHPLADKLSGGDYDGDIAWVCWDPAIVNNFTTAQVPSRPDFFKEGILSQQTDTFGDLVREHGELATSVFFENSFRFNMRQNLLGKCTNYKEALCYSRKSFSDKVAVRLSALLSDLVDQAKQGIVFTGPDWTKFKKSCIGHLREPPQPAYKAGQWIGEGEPYHLVDYLKFSIAKPIIEQELKNFHYAINGQGEAGVDFYDEDLTRPFDSLDEKRRTEHPKNPLLVPLMAQLHSDIYHIHMEWDRLNMLARKEDLGFYVRINQLFEDFRAIAPKASFELASYLLTQLGPANPDYSNWELLKASTLFKKYYYKGSFVWWIAGRQLQFLKATAQARRTDSPVAFVVAPVWAVLRPDIKSIRTVAASNEGRETAMVTEDTFDSYDTLEISADDDA
ncbi:RNA dependent RNA polymerase-domain-containing protein [Pseudomassariella vexata]|uniref:RNA-dependent RNA polymerase n=1 Tax=Pseudomassariella vexata TaxID=1141098 RepID=A0A1Y2DVU0_9PEZI|nr:RNA dependent RNA polymerase-domain-containing protein [Pseudomassariella vexata]ORY63412.1 RNA dependent RNA polymerase-domain-containing protein [Pseudomassariella vexata]